MKKLVVAAAVVAIALLIFVGATSTNAGKPAGGPPGQGECNHGNSLRSCRPDPQPSHGADCDEHGNHGGVNEDHCAPRVDPTPRPTPSTGGNPTPTPRPTPTTGGEPTPAPDPTPTTDSTEPGPTLPPTDTAP